ncbi:sensor histidine kinase [Algoriphagus halophilus]|uniref:histidine kinase n=1 Tax=Algoriphagus halophilus TaxID=226505 RepID=A0A1N6G1W4_9BACT|nr:ATP-binding protein [Algoriphagus halophilus]SIO01503.1 His Kinase A (phospho-acceptor) domain-containing protein [Algoriphagus halophilus]
MISEAQLKAEIKRLQQSVKAQALELESKNRELEIEATLERVRAKAMAMHSSEMVGEAINKLFQELEKLGFESFVNGLNIIHPDCKMESWSAAVGNEGVFIAGGIIDMNHHPGTRKLFEDWIQQKNTHVTHIQGPEVEAFFQSIYAQDTFEAPIYLTNFPDELYLNNVIIPEGSLWVMTEKELSKELFQVLSRFATVFSLTYTRYQDLQKAEAQAREAQIEVALEKIRNRTLFMKDSAELNETVSVFFQQFDLLELLPKGARTYFSHVDAKTDIVEVWMTHADGRVMSGSHFTPLNESAQLKAFYTKWKEDRGIINIRLYKGEDLANYMAFLATLPHVVKDEDYQKLFKSPPDQIVMTDAGFLQGFLGIMSFEPLKKEAIEILFRFAKAFEFTYTRFLDLQKAEAQAREAQIEAGLERVRAASMAMHKSEELVDVVRVLDREQIALGIEFNGSQIITDFSNINEGLNSWFAREGQGYLNKFHIPFSEEHFRILTHPTEDGLPFYTEKYSKEEKNKFFRWLFKYSDFKIIPKDRQEFVYQTPGWVRAVVRSKNSILIIQRFSLTEFTKEEEEIFKRFGKVFEQAYTRFLDLQKAEAQAREAEIEAGLERVRSASMAMHRSEELEKVVEVTFRQLQNLRLPIDGCQLITFEDQSKDFHFWSATPDMIYPTRLNIPYFDHPLFSKFWEARDKGASFTSFDLTRQETLDFYNHLYDKTNLGISVTKERWQKIQSIEHGFKTSWGIQKNTGLWVFNFTNHQFTEEENLLIDRFAKVFEQTYTRFLDLQKAEAQAREAEIEAALERVRSKAMAMHNTSDLANANSVVFNELNSLGISPLRSGIGLIEQETKQGTMYATVRSGQGNNLLLIGKISLTGNEVLESIFDHWSKKQIYCPKLNGQELKEYYDLILESYGDLPKPKFSKNEVQYGYFLPFKHGSFYAWTQEPFSKEELKIIQRFVSVIDLTYNRYFDLQKAEAQAREAQIEAALERIRSRSMAMHKTSELSEVILVLFKQFELLNLVIDTCYIDIFDEDNQGFNFWIGASTAIHPKQVKLPYFGHPIHQLNKNARKNGVDFFTFDEDKKSKDEYFEHFYPNAIGIDVPKSRRDFIAKGSGLSGSAALGRYSGITMFNYQKVIYTKEENDILIRVNKVFQQTYTRFLDLQKAEAQAREAQIEAALERVRSQSMAMQHSSELNLILAKVFEELTNLELQMERAVIWIYYPENKSVRWWAANPEAESGTDSFLITNQDHPVYLEYWKYWEEKRTKQLYILEGENMVSWCDVLFNEMELGRLPKEVQEAMRAPEKVYLYNTFNDFGVLFLACIEPLSDDKFSVLERFGKVFDQSYTRFKDIKQAEAREKEAIKQSSLDRVRAEIASMRKTEDLQRITPLIWRELLTLGVPFFRCGLMIVDKKEEKIRFYLSTPDGKPLAALNLDYESNQISSNGVQHWRKQQPYIAHWNKEEFLAFAKTLLEQQQIENPITYQGGEEAPESLTLQFLPFPQGMLYVGSAADLTPAQIDLVQNLADAFSVAYARYEDFKQLEDAKSKIEFTLSELKSTQAQLIQSEKMASLGELTAGIAHEIQNPLNFVNNFSEVSDELVDEMNEELENGELEEAKAIGKDLKENLSKINLHGKRADAIVKGMLEHSRINKGEKAPTDLNALADEFVRLSYHGLRAKDKSFNADFKLELDPNLPKVNVVASDIGRVILNLVNNAFYAVHEKAKTTPQDFKPEVIVSSKKTEKGIELSVQDNGPGIPDSIKEKIFQPFFTTKPTGSGTGLGLSLSYDIVKAHGGELKVETSINWGTKFIIKLNT